MKTALILPDGLGVRNFLLGSFRREARDRMSLAVLADMPPSFRDVYEGLERDGLEWHQYRAYRDTPALFMTRNVLSYAHMYSVDTWSMRCVRERPLEGRLKRRTAARAARFVGRCARTPERIRWLERRVAAAVERLPETAGYRRLFERVRPDLLLSSNQRPYGVLPAVLAARALGIPTATCIFSWDNLTSKGRIAAPFDHYFVWSAAMRSALLAVYPAIPPDRVHLVGTPQFDPYADRDLVLSREEFFARVGADPSRPLLCYSSGDPANSPEDQDHVALLMEMIRAGRIAGRPQVLLRPTPTADGRRFDAVRRRFPELIYAEPQWLAAGDGDWAQQLPLPEDVAFLANLTHHADLNVNLASTMTLDFAIHDRPVVNVAFDVASPPPFGCPVWEYYYRFEHYRPVVDTGAAAFSRSSDELAEHVNENLREPRRHAEGRRRLLEHVLGVPVGQASGRMVAAMRRIAGAAPSDAAVAVGEPSARGVPAGIAHPDCR